MLVFGQGYTRPTFGPLISLRRVLKLLDVSVEPLSVAPTDAAKPVGNTYPTFTRIKLPYRPA